MNHALLLASGWQAASQPRPLRALEDAHLRGGASLGRLDAPCLFDGPINRESFTEYVHRFLVPALRPGDVVILDNLSSHKGRAVRALIRAQGAGILFLPPYSPDLNPIEQAFATLKAHLRKAAPRAIEAVTASLGAILSCFTPQECANYLKNAGYASS